MLVIGGVGREKEKVKGREKRGSSSVDGYLQAKDWREWINLKLLVGNLKLLQIILNLYGDVVMVYWNNWILTLKLWFFCMYSTAYSLLLSLNPKKVCILFFSIKSKFLDVMCYISYFSVSSTVYNSFWAQDGLIYVDWIIED